LSAADTIKNDSIYYDGELTNDEMAAMARMISKGMKIINQNLKSPLFTATHWLQAMHTAWIANFGKRDMKSTENRQFALVYQNWHCCVRSQWSNGSMPDCSA